MSEYPSQNTRGEQCIYYNLGGPDTGCGFPKDIRDNDKCRGVIGNICLPAITGIPNPTSTQEQPTDTETTPPEPEQLPPGEII